MPMIIGKPPNYKLVFAHIHYYYNYIPIGDPKIGRAQKNEWNCPWPQIDGRHFIFTENEPWMIYIGRPKQMGF